MLRPFIFCAVLALGADLLAGTTPTPALAEWERRVEADPPSAFAWIGRQVALNTPKNADDQVSWARFLATASVDLHDRGHFQEAIELAEKAGILAQQTNNPEALVRALNAKALGHWGKSDFAPAIAALTEALPLATTAPVKVWRGNIAGNLGSLFHETGEVDLALEHYQMALDFDRLDGTPPAITAETLGNIALIWWALNEDAKALTFALEALAIREKNGDPDDLSVSLNNLGYRALKAHRTQDARNWLNRSMAIINDVQSPVIQGITWTLQGCLLAIEGELDQAWMAFLRGQALFDGTGDKVEGTSHQATFAEFLATIPGREKEALDLLQEALAELIKLGRLSELEELMGLRIKLLRHLQQWPEAFAAVEEREKMREAIEANRQRGRIAYLETAFAVAEKNRALERAALEKSLALAELQRTRQVRNSAIGVGLLVALVLFLMTWRFLEARRTNATISRQNKELARLNEEKETFMGIASHDLKAPLAAIRLRLGLVRQTHHANLPEAILGVMKEVEQTATRSLEIVTDFLDAEVFDSSLESPEAWSLANLCHGAWVAALAYHEPKGLQLQLQADSALTSTCPRSPIERALHNLVLNAIEYSPPNGTIRMATRIETSFIIVEVCDQGPGLTGNISPPIRNPSACRKHSLGLALARRLVANLGAEINLTNRNDGHPGAIAALRLPFRTG